MSAPTQPHDTAPASSHTHAVAAAASPSAAVSAAASAAVAVAQARAHSAAHNTAMLAAQAPLLLQNTFLQQMAMQTQGQQQQQQQQIKSVEHTQHSTQARTQRAPSHVPTKPLMIRADAVTVPAVFSSFDAHVHAATHSHALHPSLLAPERRKPCTCKASKCLKLYCECFAAGVQCVGCHCRDCMNNPSHPEQRDKAIQATMEKNPRAFLPKIATSPHMQRGAGVGVKAPGGRGGKAAMLHAAASAAAAAASPDLDGTGSVAPVRAVHHKGCNCRKSACLKKYCECFQNGILCSEFCRCTDCKNTANSHHRMVLEAKGQATPLIRQQGSLAAAAGLPPTAAGSPLRPASANMLAGSVGSQIFSPMAAAAASGGGLVMTPKQYVEQQVAQFVVSQSATPWAGMLTIDVVNQLTKHLLEAAHQESLKHLEQEKTLAANDLIMLASPSSQKPKQEKGATGSAATAAASAADLATPTRNRRMHTPPASMRSLNQQLAAIGAESNSAAAAASPVSAVGPSALLQSRHSAQLSVMTDAAAAGGSKPRDQPSSSPRIIPLHLPFPSPSSVSSAAASRLASPPTAKMLSLTSLLSPVRSRESVIPSAAAASVDYSSGPAALAAAATLMSEAKKRKRDDSAEHKSTSAQSSETTVAALASAPSTQLSSSAPSGGDEKRARTAEEKGDHATSSSSSSAAAPAAAAAASALPPARPSTPATASLMCDESDLASAARLDQVVKEEINAQAQAAEAEATAAEQRAAALAAAQADSPDALLYRQQEKAVLGGLAGFFQKLVQKVRSDSDQLAAFAASAPASSAAAGSSSSAAHSRLPTSPHKMAAMAQ